MIPGALKLGMVRGVFPKVNAGGCAKAAVLNHWSMVGFDMLGFPTIFGRWPPPNELVLFVVAMMASGKPSLAVQTPETCQPPMIPSTILFEGWTFFPLPTGSS